MISFLRNIFLVSFFVLSAWGYDIPSLTGPVVDQAELLSRQESAQIAQRLHAYKAQSGEQIQVLIVPTLGGEAIEQVAIQVFDQWKLGDAKKDNGVLFLVAFNDRKLRIEVGQGLEGQIPDVIAKRIINDITRPLFKSQNFAAGVLLTVEAIHQAANTSDNQVFSVEKFKENLLQSSDLSERDRSQLERSTNGQKDSKKISSTKIFLILGVLWLIIFMFSPSTAIWILFSILSGGRGGGRHGGGGGGWSGGGGSSSGGGASGDW